MVSSHHGHASVLSSDCKWINAAHVADSLFFHALLKKLEIGLDRFKGQNFPLRANKRSQTCGNGSAMRADVSTFPSAFHRVHDKANDIRFHKADIVQGPRHFQWQAGETEKKMPDRPGQKRFLRPQNTKGNGFAEGFHRG
jgi:hypothetical protein